MHRLHNLFILTLRELCTSFLLEMVFKKLAYQNLITKYLKSIESWLYSCFSLVTVILIKFTFSPPESKDD